MFELDLSSRALCLYTVGSLELMIYHLRHLVEQTPPSSFRLNMYYTGMKNMLWCNVTASKPVKALSSPIHTN